MSEKKKELRDPIEVFGDMFSKLYIYMAKEFVEAFGKKGEEALKRALVGFGHDRGRELRRIHQNLGIPISVKSLFEYYDLPGDGRFKRNPMGLTENIRFSQTLICPYQEIWRRVAPDLPDLWPIYCDTVHQAIFEGYLEDIVCELPKLLTKGDPFCQFEVYRKGHKTEIPSSKGDNI